MSQGNIIDFNSAEPQFSLIPVGTIAKAILTLQSGNYGDNKLLSKSDKTGSIGLKVCFTIASGSHTNRKIFQMIGFEGTKLDEEGRDRWGNAGRGLIRAIIESAHNIHPDDKTPQAEAKRKVGLSELHNLKCIVKVGVEKDVSGQYPDKNKVIAVITPDHKDYSTLMNDTITKTTEAKSTSDNSDFIDDDLPF